jgi:transcriptional regulator
VYTPNHFSVADRTAQLELIDRYPFGTLTTWNYVAVEVRGRVQLLDSREARLDIVDRLSTRHEADLPQPWTSAKMNAEFRDKLLAVIVAFRVHIESIDAKTKLGQNRRPEDIRSAAAALDSSDALSHQRQVAELMRAVLD